MSRLVRKIQRDGCPVETKIQRDGCPVETKIQRDGCPVETKIQRDGCPVETKGTGGPMVEQDAQRGKAGKCAGKENSKVVLHT